MWFPPRTDGEIGLVSSAIASAGAAASGGRCLSPVASQGGTRGTGFLPCAVVGWKGGLSGARCISASRSLLALSTGAMGRSRLSGPPSAAARTTLGGAPASAARLLPASILCRRRSLRMASCSRHERLLPSKASGSWKVVHCWHQRTCVEQQQGKKGWGGGSLTPGCKADA